MLHSSSRPDETRRGVWLALVLAGVLLVGCRADEGQETSGAQAASPTAETDSEPQDPDVPIPVGMFRLKIDFPGDDDSQWDLPWNEDLTVLGALKQAKARHGLDFSYRGSQDTVFLTAIDGVENEGSGGDNWVYRVNGDLGDRSCGVLTIFSGDEVVWRFGSYSVD